MTTITSFPPTKGGWIAALRSGQFRQTTGSLQCEIPIGGSAYCCLGVACHIEGQKDGALEFDTEQMARFGIEDWVPLARANDYLGWDFREIADYLETGAQPQGKPHLQGEG